MDLFNYIILFGVIALLSPIVMYNRIIASKNAVANTFSTIDVQLTKRYDLIPNLISTVKQYMIHERATLENIARLRTKALSGSNTLDEKINLNNKIDKQMSSIMIAVESYPELRASNNFMHLQLTLHDVETQLAAARRTFNAAGVEYNNKIEMFPSNLVAKAGAFYKQELFEAVPDKRENIVAGELFGIA